MPAPFSLPDGFLADLQALRRDLHAHPEVGLQLPWTQERVLRELEGLGLDGSRLEIIRGRDLTSVVGVLRGGRPGPVTLLRGDMDALPITEATGLPFASTNGAMHACGHDLHVAGLVGAARLLAARIDELPGTVILMFQPGEEGYDGAGRMLAEGLLDVAGERPTSAFGIHVHADSPTGRIGVRGGTLMAAYSILEVTVLGTGGHGSRPQEARDPVPAAAEIVLALQTEVTRRFSVFDPVVVTVGELHAGSAPNVIPDQARLRAGVRTFSAEAVRRAARELPELVRHVAAAHGLEAEVEFREVLPATVNDDAAAEEFARVARDLFGADRVEQLERPRTGSEDFSRVLEAVPGAYGFVGVAADWDPEHPPASNHSAYAMFDDEVLADQALLLATLAWEALTSGR
ncbi:M20 metallopeptidase family protein [Brachybacterium kimchii]|uniref:M20 family metallopeptidase n=1 Tax=Brachybacterium kimchii TaxID=2942909 RepID=A0ABY4N383_9MICO|nr:M20 family metallopeptidase [Brachybacterium kimchii]UQN28222.1 M20 family metallopeptidase [Brachybacterium kimchii]